MSDGRRGSVKQAPDGSWYFVVDVNGPGEKRKQTRRRGYPTRKAAQAELTRILGALEQRQYVAPKRQSVAQFLTETWLPAIEHTIKPATFESYRRNVRLHVAGRPLGRRQLQQLSPADLNALYGQLLAGDVKHRPLPPPGRSPTSPRSCTGRSGTPSAGRPSSATRAKPPTRRVPRPSRR